MKNTFRDLKRTCCFIMSFALGSILVFLSSCRTQKDNSPGDDTIRPMYGVPVGEYRLQPPTPSETLASYQDNSTIDINSTFHGKKN